MSKRAVMSGALAGLFFLATVHGQEKPVPPERKAGRTVDSSGMATDDRPLPEIDLPEFVVTGKETIDLPRSGKPQADLKVVEPGTRSFGTREQPGPLSASRSPAGNQPSSGWFGQAGVGLESFVTPFLHVHLGANSEEVEGVVKARYESSRGHVDNAEYREGGGSVVVGTYLSPDAIVSPRGRLEGSLGITQATYSPYGSVRPTMQRSATSVETWLSLESGYEAPFSYVVKVPVNTASLKDSAKVSESLFGISADANGYVDEVQLIGELDLSFGSFTYTGASREQPHFMHLGLSGSYLPVKNLEVSAGFGAYGYRGTDVASRGSLFPEFSVRWSGDTYSVFARYDPAVEQSRLVELLERNPYIATGVQIRHPRKTVAVAAGMDMRILKSLRAGTELSYSSILDYPILTDRTRTGFWSTEYFGKTRFFSLSMDASYEDRIGNIVVGSVEFRGSENTVSAKSIPYYPAFVADVTYDHDFGTGLHAGTTLEYSSSQFADVENTTRLDGRVLLSVSSGYEVIRGLKVSLQIDNIFNDSGQVYEGYVPRPRSVRGGVTYLW